MGRDADVQWLLERVAPLLSSWRTEVREGVIIELTMQWLGALTPQERDAALRKHFMTIMKRRVADSTDARQ